jgi:hypothetical protein
MVAHGRQWDRAGPSTSRPNRFSTVPHDDVLWEVALLDQEIPRFAVFPRHSRHLNPADRKAVAQQNPGPLGQKTQWHGTHALILRAIVGHPRTGRDRPVHYGQVGNPHPAVDLPPVGN